MFAAYVIVTLLAAAANAFSATLDFIRFKQMLVNMAKVGGPESSITLLGILKAAGALGSLRLCEYRQDGPSVSDSEGRTADRPPCSTLTGTPKISFMPGLE
jgi:hypothetical protein